MRLKNFSKLLKNLSIEPLHVLDTSIPRSQYTPINLSENNHDLNIVNVSSVKKLGNFVSNHIKIHKASVAYGGYLEVRNIYKRSQHFNKQTEEERNIHLGIDFWSQEGTPIYAPLEGQIHSFKNNINFGDYGPTIILEHNIDNILFYTLYGHLSLESLQNLKVGQVYKQGEKIAVLGDENINGNYPSHLHFQIIKDLQGNQGDYPGVCSKKDLEFYSKNCPDPNLLLKI
ncbi:peptidoglycan DD-metalloendopeptidase family protein [Seonamhaeicola aphaedonensis]|uniref:Peptidase M23-like protein n=1 Tax=Seonamhaeicola aphaedonensis TaxID=1461338 RepID=A0A3D9HG13_9FLAO|nr:peptidoglycan DD-metalloendopeptidase family protein [Seonamhaeicola aphaedonensis]RED48404.1 peptidase M23-like protein [Seonamhaeicola aphaedonensis]